MNSCEFCENGNRRVAKILNRALDIIADGLDGRVAHDDSRMKIALSVTEEMFETAWLSDSLVDGCQDDDDAPGSEFFDESDVLLGDDGGDKPL